MTNYSSHHNARNASSWQQHTAKSNYSCCLFNKWSTHPLCLSLLHPVNSSQSACQGGLSASVALALTSALMMGHKRWILKNNWTGGPNGANSHIWHAPPPAWWEPPVWKVLPVIFPFFSWCLFNVLLMLQLSPAPLYHCKPLPLFFLIVVQSNQKGCQPLSKEKKDECDLIHNPMLPFLSLNELNSGCNLTLAHVGYKFMSSLGCH